LQAPRRSRQLAGGGARTCWGPAGGSGSCLRLLATCRALRGPRAAALLAQQRRQLRRRLAGQAVLVRLGGPGCPEALRLEGRHLRGAVAGASGGGLELRQQAAGCWSVGGLRL
jgi:hypothetical protein